jgi:hypothetical protein
MCARPLPWTASQSVWPIVSADGIICICINMVHISPSEATLGLIKGAVAILRPRSPLYLYGPYKRNGFATASSNQAFDPSLRDRNPNWSLRDLQAVAAMAQSVGFSAPVITEMPGVPPNVIVSLRGRPARWAVVFATVVQWAAAPVRRLRLPSAATASRLATPAREPLDGRRRSRREIAATLVEQGHVTANLKPYGAYGRRPDDRPGEREAPPCRIDGSPASPQNRPGERLQGG